MSEIDIKSNEPFIDIDKEYHLYSDNIERKSLFSKSYQEIRLNTLMSSIEFFEHFAKNSESVFINKVENIIKKNRFGIYTPLVFRCYAKKSNITDKVIYIVKIDEISEYLRRRTKLSHFDQYCLSKAK